MNARELLGATAAALIAKNHLTADGRARLLLDRLTDEQVGAVCKAVLAHPELSSACALRIPRELGQRTGLPESALTDERTTWLVVTRWRDEAAFESWLSSPAFAHGHRSEGGGEGGGHPGAAGGHPGAAGGHPGAEGGPPGGERPVAVASEVWSYEVAGGSAGAGAAG